MNQKACCRRCCSGKHDHIQCTDSSRCHCPCHSPKPQDKPLNPHGVRAEPCTSTEPENEWAEFDQQFLWRDGKHLKRNLFASTIKAYISKNYVRRDKIAELLNQLADENERTEKWSDDYYHALYDLKRHLLDNK